MIKREELRSLNKAAAEEPLFVLRAKDEHAAQAVRHWAAMAVGTHEPEKVAEALKLADEMDAWRLKNVIVPCQIAVHTHHGRGETSGP